MDGSPGVQINKKNAARFPLGNAPLFARFSGTQPELALPETSALAWTETETLADALAAAFT